MTPALAILWLHLLSAVVWVGGLAYQTHVLLPAARYNDGMIEPTALAHLIP